MPTVNERIEKRLALSSSLLMSSEDSLFCGTTEALLKKSSSGGRRLVPRRQRNVRKSSVLGLSPALAAAACGSCADVGPEAVEEELECDWCCSSRAACACARLRPLLEATTDRGTSVDLAGLLVAEPWPWANLRWACTRGLEPQRSNISNFL